MVELLVGEQSMSKIGNRAGRWPMAAALAAGLFLAHPAIAETLTREAAIAQLNSVPLYPVLAKHYPATYAQVVDGLVQGANSGRRYSEMVAETNQMVATLVAEQGAKANVENTVGMLSLTRDQAKSALARDPGYCLSVLGVRAHDMAAINALPEELTKREMALMVKLLEQTALNPEPAPPEKLAQKKLEAIAMQAYDRLPSDELRVALRAIEGDPKKATSPLEQTAFCEFSIAMFDIMLAMPPIEAAQTFKGISAMR